VTNGRFTLDSSAVVGNATLFQGSVLETANTTSDLSLNTGVKVRLGMESRGKIFKDGLLLEKGDGQVSGSKYTVTAGDLRVVPVGTQTIARVTIGANSQVEVASLLGSLRVETDGGIPVANLAAGTALSFSGQASASTPTTVHGVVHVHNGQYTLTDTTSHVTFQLHGDDLQKYVGKTITATANLEGTDVLQVLNVTGGAGAGGGAAGGAGLSHAAIAGIVIGGATGLGLGIAAAAGAFSSSASR